MDSGRNCIFVKTLPHWNFVSILFVCLFTHKPHSTISQLSRKTSLFFPPKRIYGQNSMMHRSFNRELKNLDRAYNSCDLSLRSSALLMPSYECLDVDLLTQNGVFDARTKQVWVERDREVFAHLHVAKEQRKLKSVVIHCGELENYDPI